MRITLEELCKRVGGRLDGPPGLEISGVAGIREARSHQITFVAQSRYLPDLKDTAAGAVILREDVECRLPSIRVEDPYVAFLFVLRAFARPARDYFAPGIHASAVIDPTAELGANLRIGAGVVIDRGCRIGDDTMIGAGSVLMADVQVGSASILYPNVTIREDSEIGERCILHSGAVIGTDGFGFAPHEGIRHKIPQIGRVVIEDDVEIGANTCVDRATMGITRIHRGTKLDNLVQIAHNVTVGSNTVISAQTGVSGSATIGSGAVLGGQVGVGGHLSVGDRVMVGGQSGITGNIADDQTLFGTPARDHGEWRRLNVHFGRLSRYARELAELRQRVADLEGKIDAAPSENS